MLVSKTISWYEWDADVCDRLFIRRIHKHIGLVLFRFVEVAAEWSAALLSAADQERHGVHLFGRDALLLGRIISCQVLPCALMYKMLVPRN